MLRNLILCTSFAAGTAYAQTYTAQKIVFSNLGDFTQQQLEDTAGLHAGASFTSKSLGEAAQKLIDTGYFDNVGATIDGKTNAATVKIDTQPTAHAAMLHVGFENFVWLTHDQIETAIKAKIPLFNDYLPDNSPHQDEIRSALVVALSAKSITAEVAFADFEPTLRHPHREIAFRIVTPAIRVANIKLAGVTPPLVPLVQKSVNATARTAYTEGPADQTTADRILAPLLDAGYIQATLSNAVTTPSSLPDGNISVVISATLQPGEPYHLSTLDFAGTPLLSAADFATTAKLHPGDLASRATLLQTLTPIDSAYRRKGYMDVLIHADPKVDDSAHQVAYTVTVTPGEQYRIHEITPNNLSPAAKADFDRGFLMKPGELYNPEYVAGFLKANTALQALAGYSAGFKAYADPNTHLVDLVITFIPPAGR